LQKLILNCKNEKTFRFDFFAEKFSKYQKKYEAEMKKFWDEYAKKMREN